jgi:hypothetical protein
MSETTAVKKVYEAISLVMADLAKVGIAKDQENKNQKYKFRGIDDVYNTLAAVLPKHHLMILPRVVESSMVTHTTASNSVLYLVRLTVEFDFVCAEDGSIHVVKIIGSAMDSGDKAYNKAMSAAYKYACFQSFCIPIEAGDDADSDTHHVKSAPAHKPASAKVSEEVDRPLSEENIESCRILVSQMEAAQSMADLQETFNKAFNFAITLCNKKAVTRMKDVRDTRKKELTEKSEPGLDGWETV